MLYLGCMLMGLTAGFLSALLGIGGGVVVVPMLLILFAMDPKVAIGTSLACVAAIGLAGALQHGVRGNVEWKVALIVIPFGIVGTYLGVVAHGALGGVALKRIFGVLMLLVAFKLLLLPREWDDGLLMKPETLVSDSARPVAVEPARPDANDGS